MKAALGMPALLLQTEPMAHCSNGARPRPNPSIERTPSGRLRLPTVTAHVERWAPEVTSVLRVAPSSLPAVGRPSKLINAPLSGGTALTILGAGCPSVGGQLAAGAARDALSVRHRKASFHREGLPPVPHVEAGCPSFGGQRPAASARRERKSVLSSLKCLGSATRQLRSVLTADP